MLWHTFILDVAQEEQAVQYSQLDCRGQTDPQQTPASNMGENIGKARSVTLESIAEALGAFREESRKATEGVNKRLDDLACRASTIERRLESMFRLSLSRSGPTRPGPQRPRILLVKMESWSVKDKLMREARRRRGELFDDYSRATGTQRATFREPLKRLYELRASPALLYPAKLRVTTPDGLRYFLDPREALIRPAD